MKQLNDYSQRFARVLFQAFPQWEPFSTVAVENEQETEGYLGVKVPAPVSGLPPSELVEHHDDFLFIDTDGEVTVSYDYYHCHFDRYSDVPEEQGFHEAIEFILALVKEEICIVVGMNRGQWCGSRRLRQEKSQICLRSKPIPLFTLALGKKPTTALTRHLKPPSQANKQHNQSLHPSLHSFGC
ncbi:hypothetical protein [Trichocoleus sp. FACHB-262]|uniref:hypothetical protein n=1 Tax=Trichocoleus sp. FACHB-262 TaxID=2692869 RepID=UPI00168388B8|nr:hypothetical protein [Trichocoleus sp. FACHB-262]MBD2122329.1 hypothetical protein [Trichocoleus sp. FACHB-262]